MSVLNVLVSYNYRRCFNKLVIIMLIEKIKFYVEVLLNYKMD